MKASFLFFKVTGLSLIALLTSCGDSLTIRTEGGDTVTASYADAIHRDMAIGDSVTLYTMGFDSYIVSDHRAITGNTEVDGHTVFTLQGVILKVN